MITRFKMSVAGVAVAALAIFGVAIPAAATEEGDDNHTTNTTRTEDMQKKAEEAKERVKGRLNDAKKKVCETRKEVINKIMANAATAGQRHLEVFKKIQTRVEEFYAAKNITVTNYDELLAAANSKKEAAQTAVNNVKNSSASFDCNGDDPVGKADTFNGQVRAMHSALKDYRSAINALLIAVKQAAKGTE